MECVPDGAPTLVSSRGDWEPTRPRQPIDPRRAASPRQPLQRTLTQTSVRASTRPTTRSPTRSSTYCSTATRRLSTTMSLTLGDEARRSASSPRRARPPTRQRPRPPARPLPASHPRSDSLRAGTRLTPGRCSPCIADYCAMWRSGLVRVGATSASSRSAMPTMTRGTAHPMSCAQPLA